jgi:hypothetical protein
MDDGKGGPLFAKVLDQLNAVRALELGVTDHQIAVL